ncbi:MAG: hypothetical protein ACREFF_11265 [Candidatus Udaeobacter sp.]
MVYLTRVDGTVIGKFGEEELRQKIAAGDFSPGDRYLVEGSREWKRLAEFPGASFPWPVGNSGKAQIATPKPTHEKIRNVLIVVAVLLGLVVLLQGTQRQGASAPSALEILGRQAQENMELAKAGKVKVGMIEEQVEMAWGKPDHVNRYTTSGGEVEQWVYANGDSLTFRNGVLRSMWTTRRQ